MEEGAEDLRDQIMSLTFMSRKSEQITIFVFEEQDTE